MDNTEARGLFNFQSSTVSKYRDHYEQGNEIQLGAVSFIPGKMSEVKADLFSVGADDLKAFSFELEVDLLGPIERSINNIMADIYDPRDEIGDIRPSTRKRLEKMLEDLEVVKDALEQRGELEVDKVAKIIAETLDDDEPTELPNVELPDTLKALIKKKQDDYEAGSGQENDPDTPGL